jgi:ABC-2 type transport system ATP-binding protein
VSDDRAAAGEARGDERPLVVETRNLGRRFGELVAVEGVDLAVRKGEIFGVLGPNGAGKSTTIRMLCGILDPTSGDGKVVGHDVRREPELIKQRIGYMTQRFSLYEDLSVEENLTFYAGIYGVPRRVRAARVREVMLDNGLTGRRKQIAGTLSGGWKQRVALASATIHQPPLLFLDEPTAGVDPVSRRDFWAEIHRLAAGGTTVLVTTHYMDEAERCHRLCFIFSGRVLDVGRPDEIVARSGLAAAELDVDDPPAATAALAGQDDVVGVEALGHRLRVVTRGADPAAVVTAAGGRVQRAAPARISVEDAFVAMVRRQEARA